MKNEVPPGSHETGARERVTQSQRDSGRGEISTGALKWKGKKKSMRNHIIT